MDVELGTVTLLMVDQVGSTEQLRVLGDNAGQIVRTKLLDGLVDQVVRHRGTLVELTGDGFLAHFPGAALGLEAARRLMDLLAVRNRAVPADEQCYLRAGLHTGDPLVDEAGRLHGMAIVIAARLCSAAGQSEILVSSTTESMVANRPEFRFSAPTEFELRGVGGGVQASTLVWEPSPPDSSAATPVGLPLLDASFPFVGRTVELEAVAAAMGAAADGRRQVVVLSGEPGVGKTRLAGELLRRTVDIGGIVAVGVCDEDVRGPYRPVVDALTQMFAQVPPTVADRLEDRFAQCLAVLRPAAVERQDILVERYQLFTETTALVRAFAMESQPVCLLFDDLQWATTDTLAMIRHLAWDTASDPVLLVLTYRHSDVSQEHPLFPLLADLHRLPGVTQLRLRGFDTEDVVALAETAAGHALGPEEHRLAERIWTESAGNPFFVIEIIRNLIETGTVVNVDGRWSVGAMGAGAPLPLSVRDVVLRRIGRLSPSAQQVLQLAAVAGYAFDLELIVKVAGIDEDEALSHVEEALGAELLEEIGPDRFQFRHRLTRDSLYGQLSATRRARTHRRIGEAIEALQEESLNAESLAYHWSEASGLTDAARVARYCRIAGDRARARRAPEDARRFYERAMTALDTANEDDRVRCDVCLALGLVQRDLGDPGARGNLERAAQIARQLHDHERMSQAVQGMLRAGAFFVDSGHEDSGLIALIDEVLPLTTGDARARLLAARAAERHLTAAPAELRRATAEALRTAREGGEPWTVIDVLLARCVALGGPDDTEERVRMAGEAVALARSVGSFEREGVARLAELTARYELCDDSCVAELPALFAMVGQLTNSFTAWTIKLLQAIRGIMVEPAQGEELALEAYALAERTNQPDAMDGLSVQLSDVFSHTKRLEEIVELYREAAEARPSIIGLRSGWARVLLETGRIEGAAKELAWLDEIGFDTVRDMSWLGTVTDTAVVAAHVGSPDQQQRLYETLAPFAHRYAISLWFLASNGTTDRVLGLLAAALGERERALQHLQEALATERRFGHNVWVARCELDLHRVGGSPPARVD